MVPTIRPNIFVFDPVDSVSLLPHESHITGVVAWEYITCTSSHSLQDTFWNLLDGDGIGT